MYYRLGTWYYVCMSVEEQTKLADQILGSLVAAVHRDETTDPTGFTITKRRLGVHVGKIMEKVTRGDFQEIPKERRVTF